MRLPLAFAALGICLGLAGCDNGRDRLLAEIQSTRPEERALAVKRLAEQSKPDDLILFTRAAKDQAAVVRGEAASALGKSQDPRVVDLLGELLSDQDDTVQARAAMALAEIKNEKAKDYLTMQYARRGRSTRQAIVQALKSANVPGAMAQVVAAEAKTLWEGNLKALTEGSMPERVAAAEELGKSGRAEAVARLTPLLKDSQVILAAAAVRGLGFAGDHRSVAPISELLSENYPQLREAACESLLRMGDPQALPKLKEVAVERSSASAPATAAIIALPRVPETDKALCAIALEAGQAEATAAGREMRRRGGCPLDPVLAGLARLKEPVGLAALQALEALGPTAKDAVPRLLPLLGQSDLQVKRSALAALSEIGDPSAAEAVRKLYDQEIKALEPLRAHWIPDDLPLTYAPGFDPAQPNPALPPDDSLAQDAAKQTDLFRRLRELNQSRARSSAKTMVEARPPRELVEDVPPERLRLLGTALRALGRLKAPGALELLQKHLQDPIRPVRIAALEGLAALGPEGIEVAKVGLTDAEREVQSATAQALAEQGEAGQRPILDLLPRISGDKVPMLSALERSGVTAAAVPTLVKLMSEGEAEAAISARLLGQLRAREAVDALLRYLEDPNAAARRDVLLALGKIGERRAAEAVARDLYHDSPDVRAAAAEALTGLGSGAQAEPLDALKGDYYRRVREAAEQALGKVAAAPEAPK